jgi:hypothetical protein
MLYRLYPDDILKRGEAKKLSMEDLRIEYYLKSYDKYTEKQVSDQIEKELESKRK